MDGWVGNGMHAYNNKKYLARAMFLSLSLPYIVIVIVDHFRDVLLTIPHSPALAPPLRKDQFQPPHRHRKLIPQFHFHV